MSDIFISYSRKDSEQALQLAERLQGEGMSVWIDQRGIEAAASWSKEIVHAIDACKSFILLISSNSLASENVSREVSIASDSKKKMLPIAIEDVKLTDELRYHLAGIQSVAFSQHDAIDQALRSFGIAATKTRTAEARKSLMILPFEDLSPTQDNGWFADGLVSEMIDKLSKIKSLKLVDRQTSLQIKKKGHTIAELAQILEVRYFIEGSIRKFGEQIKISSALLDFETGDYLWQDTHKGVFADIFEIQEAIADKVVGGLKIHLGTSERQETKNKPTENAEAYEFYLKGQEEYVKYTRAGYERAINLYSESVRYDPNLALGFSQLANAHLELYRMYDRQPSHLKIAQDSIAEVHRIQGKSALWYSNMGWLSYLRAEYVQEEEYARLALNQDPNSVDAYNNLSWALWGQNRLIEAAEAQRECVRRRPNTGACWVLLEILSQVKDKAQLRSAALSALPLFEKHLKLNPNDLLASVQHANVLDWAGEFDEAEALAYRLMESPSLDAFALYYLACLLVRLGDSMKALEALRMSVEQGLSEIEVFSQASDLDPLRDTDEFRSILGELEAKIPADAAASPSAPTS